MARPGLDEIRRESQSARMEPRSGCGWGETRLDMGR